VLDGDGQIIEPSLNSSAIFTDEPDKEKSQSSMTGGQSRHGVKLCG
jgi:hypothetical protein